MSRSSSLGVPAVLSMFGFAAVSWPVVTGTARAFDAGQAAGFLVAFTILLALIVATDRPAPGAAPPEAGAVPGRADPPDGRPRDREP